ncbi:gamma-glutamylcyclotransferase [Tardiphaga sp. 839_C3_N1_4]|uniref:gamma-glutamylcyclotransferase n=1 Tax=unclassified Tardiphaga TaxID=2631404 RepID=UPI003F241D22
MKKPDLTREMIEAGAVDAIIAKDAPTLRILSQAEREASLLLTLAAKPRESVWLFGYGSLIWNPSVNFVERRVARVTGWHRAFCLATPAGRGSADNPGLVLGLDEGGDCEGVAFRITGAAVDAELAMLWKREMVSGAYVPRWLGLRDREGKEFGCGIAFTIDRGSSQYDGLLSQEQMVRRLATASGALGSSADYLFRTCEGLRSHGIHDPELELLQAEVAAVQSFEQKNPGPIG